jgi:hypothetical protein
MLSAIIPVQEIPAGTVLPVQVGTTLKIDDSFAGKKIEGRVMQEVPLPGGKKIKEKTRITGHVVRVGKQQPSGSSMAIQFDTIEQGSRSAPLTLSLLALASSFSIEQAQLPINSSSNVDPTSQWVTRQVGGDIVRRGWGKAGSASGVTGRWLEGSSVMIALTPNPAAGCPGGIGYDHQQAVWVFSSGACGTYGFKDIRIANSGSSQPLGEIVLTSTEKIELRSGSGWLFMVIANRM